MLWIDLHISREYLVQTSSSVHTKITLLRMDLNLKFSCKSWTLVPILQYEVYFVHLKFTLFNIYWKNIVIVSYHFNNAQYRRNKSLPCTRTKQGKECITDFHSSVKVGCHSHLGLLRKRGSWISLLVSERVVCSLESTLERASGYVNIQFIWIYHK